MSHNVHYITIRIITSMSIHVTLYVLAAVNTKMPVFFLFFFGKVTPVVSRMCNQSFRGECRLILQVRIFSNRKMQAPPQRWYPNTRRHTSEDSDLNVWKLKDRVPILARSL
jgi:hypothetical protein